MGDILIRSFGGTQADPRAWPKSVKSGIVERAPLLMARNMTWAHGMPQGREGQVSLYDPLGGGAPSTGCNGPVEIFHHVTRPGSEYIITAGYNFTLGVGGQGKITLVVSVFADRIPITTKSYLLDALLYNEIPRMPPISGFSFGTHFYIVGRGITGNTAAEIAGGKQNPVGFLQVKFTRLGATIDEADLFDRDIVSFGPGDDDGPYSSRVEGGVAVCVFQSRPIIAVDGGIIYGNTADVGGWPANNFIPTPDGQVGALGPTDRYLMIYGRRGTGSILKGGLTSVNDTSLDVVTGLPNCVSHRGLMVTREGQFVISDDGIYLCRPQAAPLRISQGIDPILFGDGPSLYAFDYSSYAPTRASLVNAPAGWSPQRRELHISLSSGRIGQYPWADAGGSLISGYGFPSRRDIHLVAHIPEGAYKDPAHLIEWGWESSDSVDDPKLAESICMYTDADGFDMKLTSSHRGRVFMGFVGDVDVVDGTATVKVNDQPSALVTKVYGSTMALAPIELPVPGRARVQKVDVGFAETRVVTEATGFTVGVAIGEEGSTSGTKRTSPLVARNTTLTWGAALPATLQTAQSRHVAPGLMGAVGADAVAPRLDSTEPMVPIRNMVLRVQPVERVR